MTAFSKLIGNIVSGNWDLVVHTVAVINSFMESGARGEIRFM